MSDYQKHSWTPGELITAELMNHIENQVSATSGEVEGAKQDYSTLNDRISSIESNTNTLNENVEEISSSLTGKVDNGYVEDGVAYFESDGQILFTITGIGGGGGGGGSGGGGSDNPAIVTISNRTAWLSTSIREGATCPISFNWTSTIDDLPTGNGTLKIVVNSTLATTMNVNQGDVTVDIGQYLKVGSNTVRFSVSDAYANVRSLVYTITTISLSLKSSFDNSILYNSAFLFPYTPIGKVEKTIHVKIDGVEQSTFNTEVSNRQMTYQVPAQTHGRHSIEMWFTSILGEEMVESNHIYYEFTYIVAGENTPIIISSFNETTLRQYSTTLIKYSVYDPVNPVATITIKEDGNTKQQLNVDRTEQTYSYRATASGAHSLKFTCGAASRTFNFNVTEVNIDAHAETTGLQLYLNALNRSNQEANRDVWKYNNIQATFSNFNWTSDGWHYDDTGSSVLRIKDDARVTIPYKIFSNDFRNSGCTIEFEFATRDVRNYDTSIISCMSGNRGINITSQAMTFASEASNIYAQFKEDEIIRLTLVIEKQSANRLIICYVNGIASAVVQYPVNDDFSQATPVNISLGCSDATLDIYNIRIYNNDLSRFQVLDNWIADTQDGYLMMDRYSRNHIFNAYGNIVIDQLPNYLPYMIINGNLPQYKGNKLIVSGEYVDPLNPTKSFIFENAQIDVQGTSSQYYARKNYKIKFNGGFTINGNTVSKYAMNDDAIPTKTFTFKADVASSEGANNVELARLYNEICPYKTPYQLENSKIRQGIDGFPIVIFHNDGNNITFLGKYNFNNDKGTEEVFGFSEGDESWEILNNTSNRVLWKSDDYSGTDWLNDFEARYPEDNTDATNLATLATWLKSTDQEQATNAALSPSVTYNDVTYTNDTAAYRLAKFKNELSNYVELNSIIFYYIFTELFLMVDSRAKNAFPSIMGGDNWCILPYDFDTALGINNEGSLTFGYNLEDIDHLTGGADIFNGQQSVLWINLRQAFYNQITAMYKSLRSDNLISYDIVDNRFETHQDKWSEAIFNEDAQYKYLDPLINGGDATYLPMLQGSKQAQRKWWLYNRFKYIDSKYNAGEALTDIIQLRGYAKANITITPYADIYPAIKYGSYLVTERGVRNTATTLINPLDNVNDTEIYIYSCSQLASIGDISGLKVGLADFSKAIKLQTLKIGDASAGYENANLTSLTLGNNTLLKSIDVRNCTALTQAVDLSGCTSLEDVYFDGTAVTSVVLPNGGVVKKLHLPGTITNLTIRNQTQISEFVCPDYSHITTLWLDNVSSAINFMTILESMAPNSRVRLYNFNYTVNSADAVADLFDFFDTMKGIDQNGNNVDKAQLYGTVHINNGVTGAQMAELEGRYPNITITYNSIVSHLYYYDFFGETLLYDEIVADGANGTWNGHPARPSDTVAYQFSGDHLGWSLTPKSGTVNEYATQAIVADRRVYAVYSVTIKSYIIYFKLASIDGNTTLQSTLVQYGQMPVYQGNTPTSIRGAEMVFSGWTPEIQVVTRTQTYTAVFVDTGNIVNKYLRGTLTELENNTLTKIPRYSLDYAFSEPPEIILNRRNGINLNTYSFNNLLLTSAHLPLLKLYINNLPQKFIRTNYVPVILDITPTSAISINQYLHNGNSYTDGYTKHFILRNNNVISLNSEIYLRTVLQGRFNSYIYIEDNSLSPNTSALVEQYKNATNWINFADIIYPITEYPKSFEDTITDSWEQIFAYEQDGTYKQHYNVGDTKSMTLTDGTVLSMFIADFDFDELAESENKAKITWIATEGKFYNISFSAIFNNTPKWCGNEEIQTLLNNDIYNLIPTNIKEHIVSVKKDYNYYNNNTEVVQNVNGKIWIPSTTEVDYTSNNHYTFFKNAFCRAFGKDWPTRIMWNSNMINIYYVNGSLSYSQSVNYNKVIGFCT